MPTLAIASYGSALRIGDGVPLAGIGLSAASNTSPIVVTGPHGITDVTVVTVSGVLGNTGANGTWIAARVSNTLLTLRGSVGNGAYAGGGGLIRTETFATVAEVTNIQDAGLTTTLVDVSALDGSGFASQLPIMHMVNTIRLTMNLVVDNPTHNEVTGLLYLQLTKTRRKFLVVLSDAAKTAWLFSGHVAQFKTGATTPSNVLTAEVMIAMSDAPVLSAA